MSYPTYLVHFNKNHDRLGRFDTGDGDGDGKMEYRERLAKNTKSFGEMSRREKKQYIKDRRNLQNEIINKSIHLSSEYNNTKKGKELRKKHDDAYEKYAEAVGNSGLTSVDFNDNKVKKALNNFGKAEKEYLMDEGRFVAKRLIEEYGAKNVSELSYGMIYPFKSMEGKSTVTLKYNGSVDDLIEQYAKEAVDAHSM